MYCRCGSVPAPIAGVGRRQSDLNGSKDRVNTDSRIRLLPIPARTLSLLSAVVIILIAGIDLAGWVLGSEPLRSVFPGLTPMKIITALCFILSASALIMLRKGIPGRRVHLAARTFGIAVGAVGVVTLISYAIEITAGHPWGASRLPLLSLFLAPDTRMALVTASLFVLYGCVLLLLASGTRRAANVAHAVLLLVSLVAYLISLEYIFKIRIFLEWMHPAVALNTGVAFAALCLASFCARPDTWLMRAFTGSEAGAIMSRRLLPAFFILPLVIGWLRIAGEHRNLFPSEVGVVLVATTYTVCFLLMVWFAAMSVNRIDRTRREAEVSLRESEGQFRSAFDEGATAMSLTTPDAKLLKVNEAFGRLLGLDDGAIVNHSLLEFTHPDDAEQVTGVFKGSQHGEIRFLRRETLAAGRTHRVIIVDMSSRPVYDDRGRLLYLVAHARDITEQREAEQSLRESEVRVRLKLESILAPEGDIGELELGDIIDCKAIQTLMNHFNALAHIPMAIIDLKGRVLVDVGWQEICTQFHRVHPDACRNCIESDTELSSEVQPGVFKLYKCKNNLWDMATPIIVGGKKMGNLFMGQFFFDNDTIDYDFFRGQAKQYGFDEHRYLAALDKVPRISGRDIDHGKVFFLKLADMLSQASYNNLKLARSTAEGAALTKSLREARDYLDNLFQHANAPIIVWDPDKRIVRFNTGFERMTGHSAANVLGRKLDLLFPAETREASLEKINRALIGEFWEWVEIPILCIDGGIRLVLWNSANVYAEDGTTLQATIAQGTDITERTKQEAELRQFNRILRALSKSSQALVRAKNESEFLEQVCRIVVKDCGHAMVWVGYAENDADKSVRPIAWAGFDDGYLDTLHLTWNDTERGRGPTGTAIRTGKFTVCKNMLSDPALLPWREQAARRGYASSIALPLTADGTAFGALTIYSKKPDPFSSDEINLLSELTSDLTQGITAIRETEARVQAEAALRKSADDLTRSNRDLEQFAYVASHDLQEPLRAVAGFMGILGRQYGEKLDADARDYIAEAVGGAERMQRLIHDLLMFSRVGTRGGEFAPVSMDECLSAAAGNLRVAIEECDALIGRDALPIVVADASQMVQLLQNLIGNAIKFRGRRRPELFVSARRGEGRWVFGVRDNGIGIEPQYFERIFLIFQRLHSRNDYEGTGIGLAVCKKIIERHGGAIWVESTAGEGSTFYFTIPDRGESS